jgi:hypothetical protein
MRWSSIDKRFLLLTTTGLAITASVFVLAGKVPLYNGIGFPDEPYRFVNSPGQPVQPSQSTDTIQNGTNADEISMISYEQGPQFSLYLEAHTVIAPMDATQLTSSGGPEAPGPKMPSIGPIAGNIYLFSLSTDKGPATVKQDPKAQIGQIQLRLPQGYPAGAIMVYRQHKTDAWQSLKTDRTGTDTYEAPVKDVGEYALISKPGYTSSDVTVQKKSSHQLIHFMAVAIGLLAIVALILVLRRAGKNAK